jgi:DNA-binding MltR family transcriptional regulator
LIAAVELLTEAVIFWCFRCSAKTIAVKYAVELLLMEAAHSDLRSGLRLSYGLGVISRHEYEDAELLIKRRREERTATAANMPSRMMKFLGRWVSCTASLPCRPRRSLTIAMPTCWQCKTALSTGRSLNDGIL